MMIVNARSQIGSPKDNVTYILTVRHLPTWLCEYNRLDAHATRIINCNLLETTFNFYKC